MINSTSFYAAYSLNIIIIHITGTTKLHDKTHVVPFSIFKLKSFPSQKRRIRYTKPHQENFTTLSEN